MNYDMDWVLDRMQDTSPRARLVCAIGISEWIVWRMRPLEPDPFPLQLLEAAWCASIDHRYMRYNELLIEAWSGPVSQPLWYVQAWLTPLARADEADWDEWVPTLEMLTTLAMHVLPDPPAFEAWLRTIMERLVLYHPVVEDDPFTDLFGEDEDARRGTLISAEVLDPNAQYDPSNARAAMARFLQSVDRTNNELLSTPEFMLQEGFTGIPYTL